MSKPIEQVKEALKIMAGRVNHKPTDKEKARALMLFQGQVPALLSHIEQQKKEIEGLKAENAELKERLAVSIQEGNACPYCEVLKEVSKEKEGLADIIKECIDTLEPFARMGRELAEQLGDDKEAVVTSEHKETGEFVKLAQLQTKLKKLSGDSERSDGDE